MTSPRLEPITPANIDAVCAVRIHELDVHWNDDDPPERTRSGLWRLNIDAAQQGHGYGRFAVDDVCAYLTERGRDEFCYVTWEPGEHGPEVFYLGLGFEPTGELSGGQTVARRRL